MKNDPENYVHTLCYENNPNTKPLNYAYPDHELEGLDSITARMKYLDGDEQFVSCPECGTIWSTNDPIFKEAERIHWHKVRKYNRERRLELASDPVYRSIFKNESEMWKHLKKCSIS